MTHRRLPARPAVLGLLLLGAYGGSAGAAPEIAGGNVRIAPSVTEGADRGAQPAAGGPQAGAGSFQLGISADASRTRGVHESTLRATATEAAMRLVVVDPETGPLAGIVVKLTSTSGQSYYTAETDAQGYAEVLVPIGQHYTIDYLTLGRTATSAQVDVPSEPNQDIRLTLRYRRRRPAPPPPPAVAPAPATPTAPAAPPPPPPAPEPERLVLEGVQFATDSTALDPSSGPRLDRVVEYLVHHPRSRVRIGGHTDNVGNPRRNQQLSEARAASVRDYLVARGIETTRIEVVGYGDSQPVATNDTPEGRARNRRIEATELP